MLHLVGSRFGDGGSVSCVTENENTMWPLTTRQAEYAKTMAASITYRVIKKKDASYDACHMTRAERTVLG